MNDGRGSDARRVLLAACDDLRVQLNSLAREAASVEHTHRVLRAPLEHSPAELEELAVQCTLYPQARFCSLVHPYTVVALGERHRITTEPKTSLAAHLQRGQHTQAQLGGRLWFALRFAAEVETGDRNEPGDWDAFGSGLVFLPQVELEFREDQGALLLHLSDNGSDEIEKASAALHALLAVTTRTRGTADDKFSKPMQTSDLPHSDTQLERTNAERERFFQSVQNALSHLKGGANTSLQKVVLARRDWLSFEGTAQDLLRPLRRLESSNAQGASYFFVPGPAQCFFGCTPELLFACEENRLRTEAVAGTRPRGNTSRDDQAYEDELRQSPKEIQEHELVASHIREALDGLGFSHTEKSVREIRRLSRVMHLVSAIEATWATAPATPNPSPSESQVGTESARATTKVITPHVGSILASLHPTPALAGSPRQGALDFLQEHEGFDRGLYAGPFGFLEADRAEVWIALRGGHWNGTWVTLYAGAGIVPGSTAAGEWQETEAKLSALREVLQEPQ